MFFKKIKQKQKKKQENLFLEDLNYKEFFKEKENNHKEKFKKFKKE